MVGRLGIDDGGPCQDGDMPSHWQGSSRRCRDSSSWARFFWIETTKAPEGALV